MTASLVAEFRMPSLGADMEFGTLVEWRVKAGDTIRRGDIIAEVETQKGVIEVDVYQSGTVEELLVPVGSRVPVGTALARIRTGEAAPAAGAPPPPPPVLVSAPRVRVSPLARRIAAARQVDLTAVRGTGAGGIITSADIARAAETMPTLPVAPGAPAVTPRPTPAPTVAADRLAALRQAIGAAMSRSHREIPHYYLSSEIDLAAALGWLERENLARTVSDRLLSVALLLKSTALAARIVPEVNGFWADGAFRPSPDVHLGVAISLRGGGLIAPAIHDADHLSLEQLMKALRDVVQRARTGGLRSSELADSTLTVTNLGDQGVSAVFGIIYPPQVALVGFGKVVERAWAKDGMVGVRPVVTATLSADHRVSDGHRGGRFLATIDRLLQSPERL